MSEIKNLEEQNPTPSQASSGASASPGSKIKTRQGSGYLKQLYSTARTTAGSTHSHLKNLTTFLVNFIPIEKVDPSELQVRVHFDEDELKALAHSIKTHGVLQPILVVQNGDRYKVIAGERRLRASQLVGLDRIPARVLSTQDQATHEIALRENLDRMDLHPIEEGEGYLSLLEAKAYGSYEAIAQAFGKPKSRITECIGFTKLPQSTKEELLKTGVKNRALLRHLMTHPVAEQIALIRQNLEEKLIETAPKASTSPSTAPKVKKDFTYELSSQRVVIPSFKWKVTDGAQALRDYRESLKTLLAKLEDWI